jgi:hypothetical protein
MSGPNSFVPLVALSICGGGGGIVLHLMYATHNLNANLAAIDMSKPAAHGWASFFIKFDDCSCHAVVTWI